MFLFYLILILFNIIQIDSSFERCRQTFGSNKYDLNQLSHLTILGEEKPYRYVLTPCGLVPTDKCGSSTLPLEQGMTSCQEKISEATFASAMGFLDGYGKSPNLEFNENPQGPGTGIVMTMRNALCNSGGRFVNVTFICDKSIKQPTKMNVVEDPKCKFTIIIIAAEACPIKEGITGGAIFIIILFVLIIIYLVCGILYNRYKQNQTGLAVIPNLSFWLLLGGMFVNGCKFTWNFVRNRGQGTLSSSVSYGSV
ncbi:unnamed protein product [Rotaria sordida]|uniref:MRH domain-containing protein n=1 Tax=Rotaria sordida TaxID=392033 RepID=A0A814P0F8_9BILA|nr:unnamed protein product [Rotaria sordida]CAF3915758.1 unnamed protein product [Rotaria sordida]CAF3943394.1 unnamed protein product [Rotaria sordida]